MGKRIYKLTIEPITCVHIGTGEQLTLLDYAVKETKPGINKYIHFSSDSILNRIARDPAKIQQFDIASTSGNIKDLQTFFQNNFSVEEDSVYCCETTKEFAETYLKNKNRNPYEDVALVEQMYRSAGDAIPVIPGSSLKGAIRTAILNALLINLDEDSYNDLVKSLHRIHDDKIPYSQGNSHKLPKAFDDLNKEIQSKLLSGEGKSLSAGKDPFRAVEISDCSFPIETRQIAGILKIIFKNYSTGEVISDPIQIQAEAIMGSLMNTENIGSGLIRINSDLSRNRNGVTKALNISDIVKSCNLFFWDEFENEYNKFYKDAGENCDLITSLKKKLQEIMANDNQFIIRVGRWSQAEFVTYEENLRSPESGTYGSTRTVFNYDGQYLPLGWCKCSVEEIKS